nr:hypothetical protein [Bacteroidota bacterium]
MKIIRKTLLTSVILFLITPFIQQLFGQEFSMINYGVKDGLPSSETYDILQDSKGYIWIATDMGVSRYNGYEFQNFSTKEGLPDNTIFGFHEDWKGRIWFRSFSGKIGYYLNDTIQVIAASEKIQQNIGSYPISSLYVDKQDTLWLGCYFSKGYIKIAPPYSDKDFKLFDDGDKFGFLYMNSIEEKGFIYGCKITSGDNPTNSFFLKMQDSNNKIKNVELDNFQRDQLKNFSRFFAKKINKEQIFFTSRNTLFEINSNFQITNTKRFDSEVLSICEDKENGLWIATKANGLYFFKSKNQKVTEAVNVLKGLTVSSCIQDKEGGFWISTTQNGIYYIKSKDISNYKFADLFTNKFTLIDLWNDSIIVQLGGNIMVLYENQYSIVKPITSIGERIFRGFKMNNNWIVNIKDQLIMVDNKFRFLKKVKAAEGTFSIAKQKDGSVWIGAIKKLFYIPKDFETVKMYDIPDRAQGLFFDAKENLWVGGLRGVGIFKKEKYTFLGDSLPVLKNRANDIKGLSDGTIC